MMHRCSGMFLAAALILGAVTGICLWITGCIMRKHIQYKRELKLSTATRREVEAQLALNLEVENFYLILMLDFINTRDATSLVYKTTMLRTISGILSADPTFIREVRSAMIRPGGTQTVLMSILDGASEHLDEDTQLSYTKFEQGIDDLSKVCHEASIKMQKAQDKVGLIPQPGYIAPVVQKAARDSVQILTADKSVKLVYDHETAAALNILEQQATTSEDTDPDE